MLTFWASGMLSELFFSFLFFYFSKQSTTSMKHTAMPYFVMSSHHFFEPSCGLKHLWVKTLHIFKALLVAQSDTVGAFLLTLTLPKVKLQIQNMPNGNNVMLAWGGIFLWIPKNGIFRKKTKTAVETLFFRMSRFFSIYISHWFPGTWCSFHNKSSY